MTTPLSSTSYPDLITPSSGGQEHLHANWHARPRSCAASLSPFGQVPMPSIQRKLSASTAGKSGDSGESAGDPSIIMTSSCSPRSHASTPTPSPPHMHPTQQSLEITSTKSSHSRHSHQRQLSTPESMHTSLSMLSPDPEDTDPLSHSPSRSPHSPDSRSVRAGPAEGYTFPYVPYIPQTQRLPAAESPLRSLELSPTMSPHRTPTPSISPSNFSEAPSSRSFSTTGKRGAGLSLAKYQISKPRLSVVGPPNLSPPALRAFERLRSESAGSSSLNVRLGEFGEGRRDSKQYYSPIKSHYRDSAAGMGSLAEDKEPESGDQDDQAGEAPRIVRERERGVKRSAQSEDQGDRRKRARAEPGYWDRSVQVDMIEQERRRVRSSREYSPEPVPVPRHRLDRHRHRRRPSRLDLDLERDVEDRPMSSSRRRERRERYVRERRRRHYTPDSYDSEYDSDVIESEYEYQERRRAAHRRSRYRDYSYSPGLAPPPLPLYHGPRHPSDRGDRDGLEREQDRISHPRQLVPMRETREAQIGPGSVGHPQHPSAAAAAGLTHGGHSLSQSLMARMLSTPEAIRARQLGYIAQQQQQQQGLGMIPGNRLAGPQIMPMPQMRQQNQMGSTSSQSSSPRVKGSRKRVDESQLAVLLAAFERSMYPSTAERDSLGRSLGMTSRSVQIWNKRRALKVEQQSAMQKVEVAVEEVRRASLGNGGVMPMSMPLHGASGMRMDQAMMRRQVLIPTQAGPSVPQLQQTPDMTVKQER